MTQAWPFAERPRVLMEHPDPGAGLELADELYGCTVVPVDAEAERIVDVVKEVA